MRTMPSLEVSQAGAVIVLPYTDIGRDPDDATAFAYMRGSGAFELAGVATTSWISEQRTRIADRLLTVLGYADTPIGTGSVYPLGEEGNTEKLEAYLREHQMQGKSYEGHGLLEQPAEEAASARSSITAIEVIHNAIATHGPKLTIAALAPMTDLAKAADDDPAHFSRIGGLFIQGQAIVENGRLTPDPAAYNLKEDMEAARRVFAFQDQIPFTFIGKYAAYTVPLLRSDFQAYAQSGHPAGIYLNTHAQDSMECFKERAPELQARIYGPEGRFGDQDVLSVPYDVLAVRAMVNITGLDALHVGHHTFYGNTAEQPGISPENAPMVKAEIHNTVLHALQAA